MKREILLSPLTGIVAKVYTPTGSSVHENDELLNIECMKLFYPLTAGLSGTVTININEGAYVEEGQELGFILGD